MVRITKPSENSEGFMVENEKVIAKIYSRLSFFLNTKSVIK